MVAEIFGNLPYRLAYIRHREMLGYHPNNPFEQADKIDELQVRIPKKTFLKL